MSTPREYYLDGPSFDDFTAEDESYSIVSTTTPAWRAVLDEASGETYYWDPASGATSWDPPFATMPEEDMSSRLGLGESETSFASGKIDVAGPKNEHDFSTAISSMPSTPSRTPQQQAKTLNTESLVVPLDKCPSMILYSSSFPTRRVGRISSQQAS
jgi:hypothetical protein